MTVSKSLDPVAVHRPGTWLPAEHFAQRQFVKKIAITVDEIPLTRRSSCSDDSGYAHFEEETIVSLKNVKLTPALQQLRQLIETNPKVYMYFTQMFLEVPNTPPYWCDPTGEKQVRDYEHLLAVLNHIVTRAPDYNDAAETVGLLGVPMCAILNYPMGTASGHAAFLDAEVNRALKKILNEWGKFLESPESASVLNDSSSGWLGPTAMKNILDVANAPYQTHMKFEDMHICDPTAPHYGFKSWDDFFTRQIREEARPIASPEDDSVIANACESKVFNIAYNVKLREYFFSKGQPYSVTDMLGQDPLSVHFAGGTVYQAFLSAVSYHRWHSPVSGIVRRAFVCDGTYFSVPLFAGVGDREILDICDDGLGMAQGYISAMAARAILIIEADNPDIGLVAFVAIGMDEISTCEITVKQGERIEKGQETGMFHYGGSSHCLLFQKGVHLEGLPQVGREDNVAVRGHLARASRIES